MPCDSSKAQQKCQMWPGMQQQADHTTSTPWLLLKLTLLSQDQPPPCTRVRRDCQRSPGDPGTLPSATRKGQPDLLCPKAIQQAEKGHELTW